MTGLIFFKNVLVNSKAEENNKNYFDLFDASYFIANQIKMANTYSIVEIKDRFNSTDNQYVFDLKCVKHLFSLSSSYPSFLSQFFYHYYNIFKKKNQKLKQ